MSPLTDRIPHKRVSFQDEAYWWSGDMLSPLDHFAEAGELLVDPLVAVSYAVIRGDKIMRFGCVIGTVADLVDVPL